MRGEELRKRLTYAKTNSEVIDIALEAVALAAELEAERDRAKEQSDERHDQLCAEKRKCDSLSARIAALEAENARFQWREGTPEKIGLYLAMAAHRGNGPFYAVVFYSADKRWETEYVVLRWMELPEPFSP